MTSALPTSQGDGEAQMNALKNGKAISKEWSTIIELHETLPTILHSTGGSILKTQNILIAYSLYKLS